MIAAECMLQTAVDCGLEVCFANPGTTEMGIVAALDKVNGMRPILGLFEGVCSGAADGYARMAGRPALTLFHLGPGFANSIANLHNARRAMTPVVNLIGDHPQRHLPYDTPLTSDLEGLAKAASHWHRFSLSPEQLPADTAEAIAESMRPSGQIASLIVPSDVAAAPLDLRAQPMAPFSPVPVSDDAITQAVDALRSGEPAALFLGDRALDANNLRASAG
jgi:acetolactate synthase-1/2/3 large subunit